MAREEAVEAASVEGSGDKPVRRLVCANGGAYSAVVGGSRAC
jgi:hypothetical protein